MKKILKILHNYIGRVKKSKISGKAVSALIMAALCISAMAVFSAVIGSDGDYPELHGDSETERAAELRTDDEEEKKDDGNGEKDKESEESKSLYERITQSQFWRVNVVLFRGLRFNVIIFFVTLALALPLGMIVTFGLMSKIYPLRWLCKTIVWIVRGSPLMLQLYIVMYAPGLLFNMPMRNRLAAALIAFVINYSMYFAEIYRGALENMPKGQFEAGKVLGLSKPQVFFHVILFQVIKNITAPIGNEVITLVKDTALARVIAVQEILMQAQRYATEALIWPLFYSIVFFLAWTAVVTLAFEYFERRLKRATGEESV